MATNKFLNSVFKRIVLNNSKRTLYTLNSKSLLISNTKQIFPSSSNESVSILYNNIPKCKYTSSYETSSSADAKSSESKQKY